MAGSGWETAMHRIDLEYHLLQFVAASLVRNIAANDFRLLPVERVNFSRLPDGVIGSVFGGGLACQTAASVAQMVAAN